MSQDQLAEMLGIGRSYICRVIAGLKREGIIEVRWKQLEVRDLARMSGLACDCNEQVKSHFNRVLRGVYPDMSDQELRTFLAKIHGRKKPAAHNKTREPGTSEARLCCY